jgi:adenosylhomocysteine nucleosidase
LSSNKATDADTWCIVAALPGEIAPLKTLGLANVTFLTTGVGIRNAQRAMLREMEKARPGGVIHVGFGGVLSPTLALGNVLIADAIGGDSDAPVDARLVRIAVGLNLDGVGIYSGVILTHDRILATKEEKRAVSIALSEGTLGCADMESVIVATVCAQHGVPYLGIRCISDTFDEDLPLDLNACRDRDGNIAIGRILWSVARQPSAIPRLMELRRRSDDCARILARVVQGVLLQAPRPSDLRDGARGGDCA